MRTYSKDSPFTYVTVEPVGVTFTVGHDSTGRALLLGASGPLGRSLAIRIMTDRVTVTTPARAFGAYGERGAGGIGAPKAAAFRPAAARTLLDWMTTDKRSSAEDGAALYAELEATYGLFIAQ